MKRLLLRAVGVIAVAALAICANFNVRAGSFATFAGTGYDTNDTVGLAASVTFTNLGGGDLGVTLVNTFTGDTPAQAAVLTGVFFDGANGLTPVSATAGPGSREWSGSSTITLQSSAVLGTEWAYSSNSGMQAPGDATAGIISSGYYTPGMGNFASPGDMLDGSAYGILSEGYDGSDKDGLHSNDYIQDTMVFILSGFTGNVSDISDVTFQYGTDQTEPSFAGTLVAPVPEPEALLPLAILIALLGIKYRKPRTA